MSYRASVGQETHLGTRLLLVDVGVGVGAGWAPTTRVTCDESARHAWGALGSEWVGPDGPLNRAL